MNKLLWCVSMVALAACGGSKPKMDKPADPTGGGMMEMKMGMADPAPASTPVLTAASGYATWPKFAENQQPMKSEGHMGMFVLSFHNEIVTAAIASKTLPLPDGALIVKEQRASAEDSPKSVTIMSKQGGEWYWISATPDLAKVMTMNGMPMEGTAVGMCKDCHDNGADNDFVLTHTFK